MKKILLLGFIIFPFFVQGQIISTIGGTGTVDNTGDGGPAIAAAIDFPAIGIFDKLGNYLFTTGINGKTIRKIDTAGIITTIAGINFTGGGTGDSGLATLATFDNPQYLAIDTIGNIYITDAQDNKVRRIDHVSGIITTIAGTGTAGYTGDHGPATSATFYGLNGICIGDSGNIYVADYGNNCIRKINALGIITTFAGTGTAGYNGDGGRADTSEIRGAFDICADDTGNIYIADEANGRIRKVDKAGIIHTIAGTGTPGYSGDGGPALSAEITPHDISWDKSGNFYSCDIYNEKIRKITSAGIIELLAGNGIAGYSGDGDSATLAEVFGPRKVGINTCSNVYFCDLNNYRIRKITFDTSCTEIPNEVKAVENTKLNIFPNPTFSTVTITGDLASAAIYNAIGQLLLYLQINTNKTDFDISTFPLGIYTLILTGSDGAKTVNKIIKQ